MTLPESIGNLKSLKKLDLSNNKLTTLRESIQNLVTLSKLFQPSFNTLQITGNPLSKKTDKRTKKILKRLIKNGISVYK
ncbi:MAG: hypothetical protein ACTSRI_18375 [Promethearchaeota archaeon]